MWKTGFWLAGAAVAFIGLGAVAPAEALPITTLFSTGVDAFGVPAADGSVDLHYTISGGGGPFVIGYPSWIGNTASSSWISPATNTYGGGGPFTYHTGFSLAGLNPGTAVLTRS